MLSRFRGRLPKSDQTCYRGLQRRAWLSSQVIILAFNFLNVCYNNERIQYSLHTSPEYTSGGYQWCESAQKCYRDFEEDCPKVTKPHSKGKRYDSDRNNICTQPNRTQNTRFSVQKCSTIGTRGFPPKTCPSGMSCKITDPGQPEVDIPNSGVCVKCMLWNRVWGLRCTRAL